MIEHGQGMNSLLKSLNTGILEPADAAACEGSVTGKLFEVLRHHLIQTTFLRDIPFRQRMEEAGSF